MDLYFLYFFKKYSKNIIVFLNKIYNFYLKIVMQDLYNKQYDRQTLKDHIYAIDFFDLLRTQKIDATFAVRYLLNKKYDLEDKYKILTPEIIGRLQPHIKIEDLRNEILNYESDDDSVTDFETVSNK